MILMPTAHFATQKVTSYALSNLGQASTQTSRPCLPPMMLGHCVDHSSVQAQLSFALCSTP